MLSFNKKYGKNVEFIIKSAQEEGNKIPDEILNAPKVKEESLFFWNCFCELGTERALGYSGIGPIPWTSINKYCEVHELNFKTTKMVINIVMRVDREYLDILDKETKKEMTKIKGKRKRK